MSAVNFFQFEQTRNFVTERTTKPGREGQIGSLERRYRSGRLRPFEALRLDKLVPVSEECPCMTQREISQAIKDFNDRLFDRPNSKPIRLIGGN
jgi:hypothetical protein